MSKPFVLLVLDGFGLSTEKRGNAVKLAKMPNFEHCWLHYPRTELQASGEAVGLPKNTLGGSEVGHLTIGAGRVIPQELTIINKSIRDDSFFKNKVLLTAIEHAKKNNGNIHIYGLLSDGGVHSNYDHLFAILKLCKQEKFKRVYVHAFLDGRDTWIGSAKHFIEDTKKRIQQIGIGKLISIIGRTYAMDRAEHWDRTEAAYKMLTESKGIFDSKFNFRKYLSKYKTEEHFPAVILEKVPIKSGDSIIDFNFRSDRELQLTSTFVDKKFDGFRRKIKPIVLFVSMAPYSDLKTLAAFESPYVSNTLAEVISKKGLRQLRIAELEKFAHVTYFFNGDSDIIFNGEERILVKSKNVKSYDGSPKMSTLEITNRILFNLKKYDFIVANFANGDMVGHTGNLRSTIKGLEFVDKQIGRLTSEVKRVGGTLIITADHGNCEEMIGKNNERITSHSLNPVPFIIVSDNLRAETVELKSGGLSNIASTILELMKIEKPKEYSDSLILRRRKGFKSHAHFEAVLKKSVVHKHADKIHMSVRTLFGIVLGACFAAGLTAVKLFTAPLLRGFFISVVAFMAVLLIFYLWRNRLAGRIQS